MSNTLYTSSDAYEEGYSIGNAGMPESYLPHKYKHTEELKRQWLLGWKKGFQDSGNHHSLLRKRLGYTFVILVIIVISAFMIVQIKQSNVENIVPTLSENVENIVATLDANTTEAKSIEKTSTANQQDFSAVEVSTTTKITRISRTASDYLADNSVVAQSKIVDKENKEFEKTNANDIVNSPQASVSKIVATFAKSVVKNNPVDIVEEVVPLVNELFFYTKFEHAIGKIITHYWYYEGQLISQKTFKEIQGKQWRLHSKQTIQSNQLGRWEVKVLDQKNNLYFQKSIIVKK